MKRFEGFPARSKYVPLPASFFSQLLPGIDDLAELKVSLHLFWLLYGKKGYPVFATLDELLGDRTLLEDLASLKGTYEQTLREALGRAVERGTLLHLEVEHDGQKRELYFINTDADRRAVARIESGELEIVPGQVVRQAEPAPVRRNIFELYEENIGVLTPKISEELKEAEKAYPENWVDEAFREAVRQNKRSWSYVEAILKRWDTEGKDDGTQPGRKGGTSLDDYLKGPYGRVVRR